jgi:hypothetical protein
MVPCRVMIVVLVAGLIAVPSSAALAAPKTDTVTYGIAPVWWTPACGKGPSDSDD